MLRLGQCGQMWTGWNKDISCPKGLSYFLVAWIFCSGFLSPSMISSLDKPALEGFQLMFHPNQYVSAKRFCFTRSINLFLFFPGKKSFHRRWSCSENLWLFSSKTWGTPKAEEICPLLSWDAALGWFLRSGSRMLWPLRDPLDICQEVLPCHVTEGALWNDGRGADGKVRSCASPRWLCFLLSDSAKQAECLQRDWILAAFLFRYQCRWSKSFSAAAHSLSVLAFSLSR